MNAEILVRSCAEKHPVATIPAETTADVMTILRAVTVGVTAPLTPVPLHYLNS